MKKPEGYGNLIVRLNGVEYAQKLISWWKTTGAIVHGISKESWHVEQLEKAISAKVEKPKRMKL